MAASNFNSIMQDRVGISAAEMAKTAPEAEIPCMVGGLRRDIQALYDSLSHLAGRLGAVRRVPVPQDSKAGEPILSYSTQTPLGNDLADMRRDVSTMHSLVALVLHELELP